MKIASLARSLFACTTVTGFAQTYSFTTLAGSPPNSSRGSADGTGGAARFSNPQSLALDGSGNVYVADTGNHTIRKINVGGAVTTLAGSAGFSGSTDAVGGAARFNSPRGIAVDAAGNVFVGDGGNGAIRRITTGGVVTTIGTVSDPNGIAVDAAGNIYIADRGGQTIRKMTPAGVVTVVAGGGFGSRDGTGTAAQFGFPAAVAVDADGNVFVTEEFNHAVRKITPAGVVTTVAGGKFGDANGVGGNAEFNFPKGIAVDSAGNVYVADSGNDIIRKVTPAGVVTTVAGVANRLGGGNGNGSSVWFSGPTGVAVDSAGNVYVADTGNDSIAKVTPAGVMTTLAGLAGSLGSSDGIGSAARFVQPGAVAVDGAGNVFVGDSAATIRRISPAGEVQTFAGLAGTRGFVDGGAATGRLLDPFGIAIDGAGNLYVADTDNYAIRKITPAGVISTLAGVRAPGSADGTGSAARFNLPYDVAADSSGTVYVADSGNHTIRRITAAGVVTTVAGQVGVDGSRDGIGAAAQFSFPRGIAVDGAGNLYVADSGNYTLRKITPSGVVTTLAGSPGLSGTTDGTGAEVRFSRPSAVAVDRDGNVFVGESAGIRKVTPAGLVTTITGSRLNGSADGSSRAARFGSIEGLAVDAAGNLFIADTSNNTVRKGAPAAPAAGSHLVNLSVRSTAGLGSDTIIVGFALAGAAGKEVLIRGVGPTLATFGVSGAVADPTLRLDEAGGRYLAQNNDWGASTNLVPPVTITATAASVGAFALPAASRDAALLPTLPAGAYTAQIGGGTGTALVEVYDPDAGFGSRLINMAARTRSGTGGDILIAGFVIAGDGPKRVLIRGIGPALAQFGVTGVLTDPRLQLFAGASLIGENDDWKTTTAPGASGELVTAFTQVGAFSLPDPSKDAALLVTLSPGSYTAQVSGAAATTGVALVEVYDLDP